METTDTALLDVLLDSWDRNNQITVNLLGLIPPAGLAARAMPSSPSVAGMFSHLHFVRLIFLQEDAPQFARALPEQEWIHELDAKVLANQLNESAKAVREAVKNKIDSRGEMAMHYDHPALMLQHLIWHEGYHQGQIKLALKLAGTPIDDEVAGPATWDLWMSKHR